MHEVVQDFLFVIKAMQVGKELALHSSLVLKLFFSLNTHVSKDHLHLVAILLRKILPQLTNTGLKSLSRLLRSNTSKVGAGVVCFDRFESVPARAYAILILSFEAAGEPSF